MGRTPLHEACARGHAASAALLIQKGAEGSARDIDGFTPLHTAASAGMLDAVKVLVDCKFCGIISLFIYLLIYIYLYLFYYLFIVSLLLSLVPLHMASHSHSLSLTLLPYMEIGLDDEDGKGETALHDAAYNGHSEVAAFLISSGAKVSPQDRLGSMFLILFILFYFIYLLLF
jgi:ankyrin repeat protein